MLSPDPPEGDPFWPASCRTLFLGLGPYLFETPGLPRTFGEIVRQIMYGEGESVGEHWKAIIEARDQSNNPLSTACKAALYDFIHTSGNTHREASAAHNAVGHTFQLNPPPATRKRRSAPTDMSKIDSLDLSDFNTSFENIQVPKGEPIGDREMKAAVDSFVESMID